jgi:molybdopterin converting factor small subunit
VTVRSEESVRSAVTVSESSAVTVRSESSVQNAVTVRYFAGAKAAAGVGEEQVSAADVGELKAVLGQRHGPVLDKVLAVSTLLVDGLVAKDPATVLPAGVTIEVLPPFAGG